jgi:glycine/D-amino acid oxidase-like deaminating enzyme
VIEKNGPVVVGTGVTGSGFACIPALGRRMADLTAGPTPSPTAATRTVSGRRFSRSGTAGGVLPR